MSRVRSSIISICAEYITQCTCSVVCTNQSLSHAIKRESITLVTESFGETCTQTMYLEMIPCKLDHGLTYLLGMTLGCLYLSTPQCANMPKYIFSRRGMKAIHGLLGKNLHNWLIYVQNQNEKLYKTSLHALKGLMNVFIFLWHTSLFPNRWE